MPRKINCGGREIVFTVKRSRRRRTVALQVEPSGTVTVFAPSFVWGPFIDRFVRKQRDWIFRKLDLFKSWQPPPVITPAMRAEYHRETEARLPDAVNRIAALMGVAPRSVRVAHQTRPWGSCSVRGDVRFSWRVGRLPVSLFDYVVAHELAHLKQMNHSPRFWAVVASVIPDHKALRKTLRKTPL